MEAVIVCSALILFLSAMIFVFFTEHRKEKSTWTGILEDKKIHDYFYNGHYSNLYIVYIRKENGERVTYSVNENIYNSFNLGDKVKKGKGEYFPTAMN